MTTKAKTIRAVIWIIVIAVLATMIIIATRRKNATPEPLKTATTLNDPSTLPGLQTGNAPWSAESKDLGNRLSAIGLPALAEEGTVLHTHQHLDIFIDGTQVAVPAEIGVGSAFIAPIHTHDETGIIHVESPTLQSYSLGQFFDIWGVRFTNECIGSYCTSEAKSLRVYVNGKLYQGDPRKIELLAHQELAIVYGTAQETPKTIPASFAFPSDY